MHKIFFYLMFFQCTFFCCSQTTERKILYSSNFNYDFTSPSKVYTLPLELNEISGITYLGDDKVACIQDEDGIIFIYDLKNEVITERINFADQGDYEDIVKVGNSFYILQSNGVLFEYSNGKTTKHLTPLSKLNNTEGLCFNSLKNSLLISCKESPKLIYSFSLETHELNKIPLFRIKMKGFAPTACIFENNTDKIYILANRYLALFNTDGTLKELIQLDPSLFSQPEGITFKENGDLLISNETNGRQATILQFKYRKA